jgi:hypothetical protein
MDAAVPNKQTADAIFVFMGAPLDIAWNFIAA